MHNNIIEVVVPCALALGAAWLVFARQHSVVQVREHYPHIITAILLAILVALIMLTLMLLAPASHH